MDKFVYVEEDKITVNGETLYRILANRDIETPYITILKGEKGGYIARDTLSQTGNCWIDENSIVLSGSYISGNALILNSKIENALVEDNAVVVNSLIKSSKNSPSTINGNSKVVESTVKGTVEMNNRTRLDTCKVNGNLKMFNLSKLINCNINTEYLEVFNAETVVGRNIVGAGNLQTANVESPKRGMEF